MAASWGSAAGSGPGSRGLRVISTFPIAPGTNSLTPGGPADRLCAEASHGVWFTVVSRDQSTRLWSAGVGLCGATAPKPAATRVAAAHSTGAFPPVTGPVTARVPSQVTAMASGTVTSSGRIRSSANPAREPRMTSPQGADPDPGNPRADYGPGQDCARHLAGWLTGPGGTWSVRLLRSRHPCLPVPWVTSGIICPCIVGSGRVVCKGVLDAS